MMKYPNQQACTWLLVGIFHYLFMANSIAQCTDFSAGKSLHQVKQALLASNPEDLDFSLFQVPTFRAPAIGQSQTLDEQVKRGVFLPRWSAENLPFFCKIEHDWAKGRNRIPVKFRLGSVDYVDWLEGKSWDKTRY